MNNREQLIQDVKEAVYSISPNANIILFGSRSRGDYSEESDWDFLILTDKEATEELKRKIRYQVFDVQLERTAAISSIIYSKTEWEKLGVTPLYKSVASDGIPV
jgi:predicted nucleotidyltransferase